MSRRVDLLAGDMLYAFDQVFRDPYLPAFIRQRRRTAYSNLHRMLAGSFFVEREWSEFAKHAFLAVRQRPSAARYLVTYPWRRAGRRERTGRLVAPDPPGP